MNAGNGSNLDVGSQVISDSRFIGASMEIQAHPTETERGGGESYIRGGNGLKRIVIKISSIFQLLS